jgi:hypothetical protein
MVSEGGGAFKPLFGSSPWIQGSGIVTQSNLGDKVGIGTNGPLTMLDINNDSLFTGFRLNTNNTSNSSNALQVTHYGSGNAGSFIINNASSSASAMEASTNGDGRAISATTYGNGQAGNFTIANSSNGSVALNAKTTGIGDALFVEQGGTAGRGGVFVTYNNSNTSPTLFSQTAGLGTPGFFENINTSSNSNALTAVTYGTGSTIFGNNMGTAGHAGHFNIPGGSTNTSATLFASNIASGNAFDAQAGSGAAIYAINSSTSYATAILNNAGQGITLNASNSSNNSPVAYIVNNGNYRGLVAASTLGTAVYAESNGGNNTFEAYNMENGNSIYAYKNNISVGGNAANFVNNSPNNPADAVFVRNDGAGAAIHAVSGPPVSGGTNAALWIENGHVKSTQAIAPTVISYSVTAPFTGASSITLTNGTDVKGSLLAVCTTSSSSSIYAGGTITFKMTFSKQYQVIPTVVVCPTTDIGGLSYFVSGISANSFFLTIKNSSNSTVVVPSLSMSFNYFVIE